MSGLPRRSIPTRDGLFEHRHGAVLEPPLQGSDFFDDAGRGKSLFDRNSYYPAAARLDRIAPDDRVVGPVSTLDENVRLDGLDDLGGSVFREDDHAIDALERSEDLGALLLVVDRPLRSLV